MKSGIQTEMEGDGKIEIVRSTLRISSDIERPEFRLHRPSSEFASELGWSLRTSLERLYNFLFLFHLGMQDVS